MSSGNASAKTVERQDRATKARKATSKGATRTEEDTTPKKSSKPSRRSATTLRRRFHDAALRSAYLTGTKISRKSTPSLLDAADAILGFYEDDDREHPAYTKKAKEAGVDGARIRSLVQRRAASPPPTERRGSSSAPVSPRAARRT